MKYTRRKWALTVHRPTMGSRWWYGNFGLGLMLDNHPRFFNLVLCLVVVDVCIGWTRDAIILDEREP